jgi:DnaJ family protein C protein 28
MNAAERERRERREQLRRARSKLDERQLPRQEEAGGDRPRGEDGWRDLVEQRIREAMAAGAFENLSGQGRPLNLARNPYLDPSLELAYGLLKNNGCLPEWIARDKEIREELEAARARLSAAWAQREADWPAAVARFEKTLAELNRKIDNFNLVTPIVSCQRARLSLADELRRARGE